MPFDYNVRYIGNKYDTDKPWSVNRPGGMSYYQNKANAEAAARNMAKQKNGKLRVFKKNGTLQYERTYGGGGGRGSSSTGGGRGSSSIRDMFGF